MKKIFNNSLYTFIIGLIIAGGIGVIASTLTASNISYKDGTVEEAIDDLYTKTGKVNLFNDYNVNTAYATPIDNTSFRLNQLDTIDWYDLGLNTKLVPGRYRVTISGLNAGRINISTTNNKASVDTYRVAVIRCDFNYDQVEFEVTSIGTYYAMYCSDIGTPQAQDITLKLEKIE